MSRLRGNLHQRNIQTIGQHFGMGISHHEAGHIAALYRTGPGADTDRGDFLFPDMGKQPAGKLRQAFDMCKYGVGLSKTQLTLLDRQQAGAIHTIGAVKYGNGGGVIAGIKSDHTHVKLPQRQVLQPALPQRLLQQPLLPWEHSGSGQRHPEYR